jgi:hypothetical protein
MQREASREKRRDLSPYRIGTHRSCCGIRVFDSCCGPYCGFVFRVRLMVSWFVSVHGASGAPRPATLPRRSLPLQTHSSRQRCGEGLGEGNPAKSLCPSPPARERLPWFSQFASLSVACAHREALPGVSSPRRGRNMSAQTSELFSQVVGRFFHVISLIIFRWMRSA